MIKHKETLALNPVVPHPELWPIVISLNPLAAFEYSKGFKKPRGGKLCDKRTSFRRDTIPAKVGDDAEVPPMWIGVPLTKIRKRSDCAETSGNAYVIWLIIRLG